MDPQSHAYGPPITRLQIPDHTLTDPRSHAYGPPVTRLRIPDHTLTDPRSHAYGPLHLPRCFGRPLRVIPRRQPRTCLGSTAVPARTGPRWRWLSPWIGGSLSVPLMPGMFPSPLGLCSAVDLSVQPSASRAGAASCPHLHDGSCLGPQFL